MDRSDSGFPVPSSLAGYADRGFSFHDKRGHVSPKKKGTLVFLRVWSVLIFLVSCAFLTRLLTVSYLEAFSVAVTFHSLDKCDHLNKSY